MGFSYDYYITRSEYNAMSEADRELVMLRAIVLEDDRAAQYDGLLRHLPDDRRVFDENRYVQDCLERAATSCETFQYTRTGFTASLSTRAEELVSSASPTRRAGAPRSTGRKCPSSG